VVTRLPAGLRRRGGWGDTVLPLPGVHWRDVLTGVRHAGTRPPLDELTRRLPVALLIPDRLYDTEYRVHTEEPDRLGHGSGR
jgi:(1->4)-alpha-D-glucan 1-alpha-D-glucosylmutase